MKSISSQFEDIIGRNLGSRVAIAFYDFETGQELLAGSVKPFHPASMFKVCVMMTLYAHPELLDVKLNIRNSFASIVDGSLFSLDPVDDSEQTLYERIGEYETLRELCRHMIVRSSNLATNLILEKLSPVTVEEEMVRLGAPELKIVRGVEDKKAFQAGMNNSITAHGLLKVFRHLVESKSDVASQEMIRVLLKQELNNGIPAGLPARTPVAHKTGWIDGIFHDGGIIFPSNQTPYVLVVLTEGLPSKEDGERLVAEIATVASLTQ